MYTERNSEEMEDDLYHLSGTETTRTRVYVDGGDGNIIEVAGTQGAAKDSERYADNRRDII